MAGTGYCTTDDVRRVLQETDAEFDSGALGANGRQAVVDAIAGLRQWTEKATKRHWYVSAGITEDDENVIPASANTRDDEHSLPTHGGYVVGAYGSDPNAVTNTTGTVFSSTSDRPQPKEQIRLAFGNLDDDTIPAYTRITLARKDVTVVNTLNVVNEDGGYAEWVGSADYDGGVGNTFRGDDFWVRENNDGRSELYIDVHALDDDIASLRNAVYIDIDYGEDELPSTIRRGTALLAASELVLDDEFVAAVSDQGQIVSRETKAQRWERRGIRNLENEFVGDPPELPQ